MSNKSRKIKSDYRLKKNLIFNKILENGINTTKADILNVENPMEDKVYTKRININKPYKDGVQIMAVSLTTDTNNFTPSNTDISIRKVRVNTKNAFNMWLNLFIDEVPNDIIDVIYTTIE